MAKRKNKPGPLDYGIALNLVLLSFVGRWNFSRILPENSALLRFSALLDLRVLLILSGIAFLFLRFMYRRNKRPDRSLESKWAKASFWLSLTFFG